jgi:hypothetical protein
MTYRLFGAETSAYSTKMRSYLTYKSFAFDWVPRTQESESELKRLSRFATLPGAGDRVRLCGARHDAADRGARG